MIRTRYLRLPTLLWAWVGFMRIAAAAGHAEFAMRWNPADGGPASVEQIAQVLQVPADGTREKFEVRYFSLARTPDTPDGALVIVRERLADGQAFSMYKLRSNAQSGARGADSWSCPLLGREVRTKTEVDVDWDADGKPSKSHSLSCEARGRVADRLPATFKAEALGCISTVLRVSTGGFKIEHWFLPAGAQIFEVSANGKDSARQLDAFAQRVVQPLMAHGATPLKQSKTQMGSSC